MKGVAANMKGVKFDAWAQHPYPFPVNQKPTQLVRYPNVTLMSFPRFEKDLDAAFKRKNVPIWITEYGNETKPGEPKGVTEAQQAAYIPQAIGLARKDPRVQMFIWFVMQDSQGSLWQSGIYRQDASPKRAQPAFAKTAKPLSPVNGKMTVRGGTKNPKITVYLREYCANNPAGATVGYTIRSYLKHEARGGQPGRRPARPRLHREAARGEAHGGEEEDLPRHGDGEHGDDRRGSPHDHDRRRVADRGAGSGRTLDGPIEPPRPTFDGQPMRPRRSDAQSQDANSLAGSVGTPLARHRRRDRADGCRSPDMTVEACVSRGSSRHGAEGARTPDLRAASATLSQLSYGPEALQCSFELVVFGPIDASALIVLARRET